MGLSKYNQNVTENPLMIKNSEFRCVSVWGEGSRVECSEVETEAGFFFPAPKFLVLALLNMVRSPFF